MSLTVKAYVSDGSVLLALDMPEPDSTFAGFAIFCKPSSGNGYYLPNRLSFTHGVSISTTAETRVWTPSNKAPFQKFYWVDFPKTDETDQFAYTVTPMYFVAGDGLKEGNSASVNVDFNSAFRSKFKSFRASFTRGYLSSQAYAEQFHNAAIRPAGRKTMDYDTAPFEKQYAWLGYTTRKMIFDFLKGCLEQEDTSVDLFAYDLDEPDFIRGLIQLAHEGRLRAFLDDSKSHVSPTAVEPNVRKALADASPENVVTGHFLRFAHDKVLIQRDKSGQAIRVLTGSANFSVRGLYVQANNTIVVDDPATAAVYGEVFDTAFEAAKAGNGSSSAASAFKASSLSKQWFTGAKASNKNLPEFQVSFAPHTDPNVSLEVVDAAIKNAKSSVLFAVMELAGGGNVLQSLSTLDERNDIFSYGITQSSKGITLFKPGSPQHGEFATFAYLQQQVPAPFREETSGGMGQVIHNKFIVVDFNGDNPVVFTGSSNLSSGGESQNGDNLLAIYDKAVATAYAVEAIRLVDHYHFRMMQKQNPSTSPITLQGPDGTSARWWSDFYKSGTNKYYERLLFTGKKPELVKTAPVSATRRKHLALQAVTKQGKTAHLSR